MTDVTSQLFSGLASLANGQLVGESGVTRGFSDFTIAGSIAARLRLVAIEGSPTVTAWLEHSDDNATWTRLLTFTPRATDGEQIVQVTGPKKYVRAAWSMTGSGRCKITIDVNPGIPGAPSTIVVAEPPTSAEIPVGQARVYAVNDAFNGVAVRVRARGARAGYSDGVVAYVDRSGFTADAGGTTVEHAKSELEHQPLTVDVDGRAITVNFATGGDAVPASADSGSGDSELDFTAKTAGADGNDIVVATSDGTQGLTPAVGGVAATLETMESGTGWSGNWGGFDGVSADQHHDGSNSIKFHGGDPSNLVKKTHSAVDLSAAAGFAFWIFVDSFSVYNHALELRLGTSDSAYWSCVLPAGSIVDANEAWYQVVIPKSAFTAVGGIAAWTAITQFVWGLDTGGGGATYIDTFQSLSSVTGASVATSVNVDGTEIDVTLGGNWPRQITATAADVKAAIEADSDANALVAVGLGAGDGSGVVAVNEVDLTGGLDEAAETSNAADVVDAIQATPAAAALVAVKTVSGSPPNVTGGPQVLAGGDPDSLIDATLWSD